MFSTMTTLTTAIAASATATTTTSGRERFSGSLKIALIVILGVFGVACVARNICVAVAENLAPAKSNHGRWQVPKWMNSHITDCHGWVILITVLILLAYQSASLLLLVQQLSFWNVAQELAVTTDQARQISRSWPSAFRWPAWRI